jgi:hypothetical protein
MKFARVSLILSFLLGATFLPIPSNACQCRQDESIQATIERCALIFRGVPARYEQPGPQKVTVDGKPVDIPANHGPVRWYFVPTAAWKGEVTDTVLVYAYWFEVSCGRQFPIGRETTVFAFEHDRFKYPMPGFYPTGTDSVVAFTTLCEPAGDAVPDELGPPVWTAGER